MGVSRSAYHAYRSGKSYVLSSQEAAVGERVSEVFYAHRRRYGARRIAAQLKDEGIRAGRWLVRSQMPWLNLRHRAAPLLPPDNGFAPLGTGESEPFT